MSGQQQDQSYRNDAPWWAKILLRRAQQKSSWVATVEGGVVGWVSGGEPVGGCDLVTLLIHARTPDDVRSRANEIGLWNWYEMDTFGHPPAEGVDAAVDDPEGFVWQSGVHPTWQGSAALVRPV